MNKNKFAVYHMSSQNEIDERLDGIHSPGFELQHQVAGDNDSDFTRDDQ